MNRNYYIAFAGLVLVTLLLYVGFVGSKGLKKTSWTDDYRGRTSVLRTTNTPTIVPSKVQNSPTPVMPTIVQNGQTSTYKDGEISFSFPSNYRVDGNAASRGYLALYSPDDGKENNSTGLNELKIEFYLEASVKNDTPEKCYLDNVDDSDEIISRREAIIAGQKTTIFSWEWMGNGDTFCLIKNGKRYVVTKYPLSTSRQSEYDAIVSSLVFVN